MKTLKLLLLAVLFGGCVTAREDGLPIDKTRVYNLSRLTVYSGVRYTLAKNPAQREPLERARAGIYTLVSHERWDVAAVSSALVQAGVTEASSSEAELVVAGVTILSDLFFNRPIDLSKNRTAEAYVRGADAGIRAALEEPAARAFGETATGKQFRTAAESTR